ncbi:MAG: chitobiase/beta-hexosaminidase C-terminal domain-containing protein [Terracidiphilus sp.]|jgi:hypothetical protein
MEASRLRTLMMKSRLLTQALCFLSLFLIIGVQGHAQNCTAFAGPGNVPPSLGNNASLNGFLPYSGNPNSIWNTNILSAPIDPNSANIIAGLPIKNHLHPDFGPDGGIPYVIVDSTVQPFINMNGPNAGPIVPDQSYASQSDDVVEPAPLTGPIEGAQPDCLSYPANGGEYYYFGDTHLLVVDRAQCWLYETYLTTRCDGVYNVSGQAIWDLQYGEQRPWGWTSTDAAGDAVFPGLLKFDEVCTSYVNDVDDVNNDGNCAATQAINHAVRFTVENTKGDGDGGYFVLPDTHAAAYGSKYKYLNVMGMQLRLRNDVNTNNKIATYSPINQAIFAGLQNYGMILADNGGNLYISGTTDSRWNTDDLGNWHGGSYPIEATDFDVIQMQVGVGVPDLNTEDAGSFPVDQTWSYMDANSAPYTVQDVEAGTYAGGLGPEGTSLSGGGKYPTTGPTGVTPGPPPAINSFTPYDQIFGFPIAPISCGNTIIAGYPIVFEYNITSAVPVIPGMGDFYSYIDNAGPVRVDGAGDGYLLFTPTETQAYTLYSMNADGMSVSSPCTLYTNDSYLPVPVLSPPTGTYNTIISVTITEPGYPGATIYYTTDETEPAFPVPLNSTEQIYNGAITITATSPDPVTYLPGEQINAIAVDTALFSMPSGIGSGVYIVSSQAPAPVITPPSGTYNLPLTITITEDPSFEPIDVNQDQDPAYIYYTTDGTTPGGDWYGDTTGTSMYCAVGIYGNGPCTFTLVGGMTTVNAVADAVGYSQSAVATAVYNVPLTFTVTVAPLMITIPPQGNAGSVGVTITSENGYVGTVNLSCAGLPPGDVCVFNPSSVSVTTTTPGISALTISSGQNASLHHNSFPLLPGGATLAVALCFFGFRKRRRLQLIVLLAASVIGLSLFTGCGTPGSLPISLQITVIGTDSSGAPVVTTPLTLTQIQSL